MYKRAATHISLVAILLGFSFGAPTLLHSAAEDSCPVQSHRFEASVFFHHVFQDKSNSRTGIPVCEPHNEFPRDNLLVAPERTITSDIRMAAEPSEMIAHRIDRPVSDVAVLSSRPKRILLLKQSLLF